MPSIKFARKCTITADTPLNLFVKSNNTHKFMDILHEARVKYKHLLNTNMAGTDTVILDVRRKFFISLIKEECINSIIVIPLVSK